MNLLLWSLQLGFGGLFILHGFVLLVQPAQMLERFETMPYGRTFLRRIGLCEVLGGLGLLLPWSLDLLPWLTPLAAFGLTAITMGASAYHHRIAATLPGTLTALLGHLLVLLAIGRLWIS